MAQKLEMGPNNKQLVLAEMQPELVMVEVELLGYTDFRRRAMVGAGCIAEQTSCLIRLENIQTATKTLSLKYNNFTYYCGLSGSE